VKVFVFQPTTAVPPEGHVVLTLSERQAEVLRYIAARDIVIPCALQRMGPLRPPESLIIEVEDLQRNLQIALDNGGIKTA
jgi:hypothetical protein